MQRWKKTDGVARYIGKIKITKRNYNRKKQKKNLNSQAMMVVVDVMEFDDYLAIQQQS